MKYYNTKVIVAGNILEKYTYENPVFTDYQDSSHSGRSSSEVTQEDKIKNRDKVLSRARKDLRRLINTNIGANSKFVTLTFKENLEDLTIANYEFKKFIDRLKYKLKIKVQYAVVPEFQKRGAIHYHVVLFNVGYIPHNELAQLWGHGFVKINKISEVDNVGAYVCKYMNKENNDDRLLEKKCYFTSKNLDKPYEMTEKMQVENLVNSLPAECKVYENSFKNEHLGKITYTQYNLNI